jgi:Zn2+/Cd2+-exporting ATPase
MKLTVNTTAQQMQRAQEALLTKEEKNKLGIRIISAMMSCVFLMVGMLYEYLFPTQETVSGVVLLAGALTAGFPIFKGALQGFLMKQSSCVMEQLVAIALLASMAMGDFKTAILIPIIVSFVHFLEERSILGAQSAIDGLKTLQAKEALLITSEGEELVKSETLEVGDLIKIKPGDMLPVDGEVVEGQSSLDQSSLTGEALPVDVAEGARVFSGTVNLQGYLIIRVTKKVEDTSLSRILEVMKEAEQSRTPVMRLIEQYMAYYLPAVIVLAVAVLFITGDMSRVIAVIIVSCPCAQVLVSSTAMISSLSTASRNGVLIKNSSFLEVLGNIKTIIFDKTGTLTKGNLNVTEIRSLGEYSEAFVLEVAASAAQGSNHPVSRAIVRAAEGLELLKAESIQESMGLGVTAVTSKGTILLGKRFWLEALGLKPGKEPEHNGTIVWAVLDNIVIGYILLEDCLRAEAAAAVKEIRKLGVERAVLVTGDRKQTAASIRDYLALDDVYAECLPQDKLTIVEKEQEGDKSVMVIGDGVNDAPALVKADVGIAMGAMGSDIAIKSSDIAFMGNDLTKLSFVISLSRKTKRIIYENMAIAAISSMVMLLLASIGIISPIAGTLLHNIGTFLVLFNSARLLRFKVKQEE